MVILLFRFLETLQSIAESNKRLVELIVELMEQQRYDSMEDAKRQKKQFYIQTALCVTGIIVAIIFWVFPRA